MGLVQLSCKKIENTDSIETISEEQVFFKNTQQLPVQVKRVVSEVKGKTNRTLWCKNLQKNMATLYGTKVSLMLQKKK